MNGYQEIKKLYDLIEFMNNPDSIVFCAGRFLRDRNGDLDINFDWVEDEINNNEEWQDFLNNSKVRSFLCMYQTLEENQHIPEIYELALGQLFEEIKVKFQPFNGYIPNLLWGDRDRQRENDEDDDIRFIDENEEYELYEVLTEKDKKLIEKYGESLFGYYDQAFLEGFEDSWAVREWEDNEVIKQFTI